MHTCVVVAIVVVAVALCGGCPEQGTILCVDTELFYIILLVVQ